MADDKFILRIGATTTDLDAALKRANAGLAKFKEAIFSLKGAIAGFGIAKLTQNIVDANIEWQKIHYTLLAVTGSTKAANSEFDFVRQTSDKLGLSLQDAAQGYARLAASAYGAGVTTQQLHTAFTGLSEAFTVLHTPAQDTQRVLLQLEQTLSKGKVQTQDLNAITNSLPKVYETAAKAFGVTGAKFQQMLQNGLIPGSEFLIKFSAQLHKEFGPTASQAVDSLNSQINLLHNALFDLETQGGRGGFVGSFTDAVQSLSKTLSDPSVEEGVNSLINALGTIISWSARAGAAVANFSKEVGVTFAKMQGYSTYPEQLRGKIAGLKTEIAHLQETLNAPAWKKSAMSAMFGGQMPEWQKNTDALKKKITELQKQLAGAQRELYDYTKPPGSHTGSTSGSGSGHSGSSGSGAAGTGTNPNQTQIESILLQLKQQASEYGKSSTAVALYRLQLAHATPAEMEQAKALAATIDTLKRQAKAEKDAISAKRKAAEAAKQHAKALDQEAQALKDQLDPMEPLRRELAQYDELLKTGRITQDEWSAATFKVNEQMDQLNGTLQKTAKSAKASTSEVDQFAVQAARNIQGVIANTLENGFKGSLRSVVDEFGNALRKMASEATAADLGKRLFGNMGGTSGSGSSDWGWVGTLANWATSYFHEGGLVGSGGRSAMVPALAFAGAPRLHSGGGFGLKSDEVPAILQKGEYVMSRNQLKNAGNGGVTIHAPITINTPDANSFQKAKGQIAADVSAMLERAAQRYR